MSEPELLRGAIEARLLEVERGINAIGRDLRRIGIDQTGIQQQLWEEASTIRRRGPTPTPTPTPTPNTSFSGAVWSVCSNTSVDASIVITDAGTGSTLWTGSATIAGGYSGSIYLASNTSVTITATGTHARMGTGSTTVTLTAGGSNSITAFTCNPASGYHCLLGCRYPLGTMNVHDHRVGTIAAMTYSGVLNGWFVDIPAPSGGTVRVAATTTTGVTVQNSVVAQDSLACWDGVTAFAATYHITTSTRGYISGDLFDFYE